ncbi:MAG: sensor histidine kinase [Myxococcota bacterium]
MFDLYLDTLAALTRTRRLIPILIVCVPLLIAQHFFSYDGNADALAVLMIGIFVAVGPFSYRAIFGVPGFRGSLRSFGVLHWQPWARLLAFGVLGGLPALLGLIAPRLLGIPYSFLTYSVNLGVAAALFWVGSWGLARDIQQEQSLEQAERRAEALMLEAEHARLLALEAHLDPHFLFNTLNAIAEWVREDPAEAEAAILKLSEVLREIMEGVKRTQWPLSRELDLVRSVWALHAVRDPDRYQSLMSVPDPVPAVQVPPMVLLPLAENAVKHGPAKGHEGVLRLSVRPAGQGVEIELHNPGPYTGPRDGGEGVPMVRKRLSLAYGDTAQLVLESDDTGTLTRLTLPALTLTGAR